MNVSQIYAVANGFKAAHLSPLQFARSRRRGQAQATGRRSAAAAPSSTPAPSSDAHFDEVMSRSAALLDRTDPNKAKTPEGKAIIKDANRARGRDHAVLAAQDRGHVANVRASLSAFDDVKKEIYRTHVSRTAEPAPSAPVAPARTAPAVTPTPVRSESQFSQPKQSDYRQAATPAPRPTRTYLAPVPEPMTPPAGQTAPKAPTRARKAATPSAAPARTAWNSEWDHPTHWSANLPSRSAAAPAATPAAQPKPRAPRAQKKAAPAPAPAKPSDSEWHSMLSDSVAEHQATKATPAPAPSSSPQFRETKLTVGGKEAVIRTEHNGSQSELDAMHTKAVKAHLAQAYAPEVQAAEQRVAHAVTKSSKTAANGALIKTKRKARGYDHATPKEPNRMYGNKKQLSMFEGDGPDDPQKSHQYGLEK